MKRNIRMIKRLFLIGLFLLAFGERVAFDMGPNVELVTLAMVVSGIYFGAKSSFWLIFGVIVLSDLAIGNSNIFIFTWSGFLVPALVIGKLGGFIRRRGIPGRVAGGGMSGLAANLFFYLWTNFGVWALDGWGMYSDGADGLLMSYVNGLPFLKLQALSTLLFVPAGMVVAEVVRRYSSFQEMNWYSPVVGK